MKFAPVVAACCVLLTAAEFRAEVPAVDVPDREKLAQLFEEGVKALDTRYWSPALSIWLDRPGDDLRAHYEGRRNPPWWPSANAVETLIDFMNSTRTAGHDVAIGRLYELQKDRPARTARVVAELKRRQQWSDADEETYQRRRQRAAERPADPHGHYTDFQNEYLDDSGWWALAWLKMHDRTRAPRYLATAKTIHAHMAKSWRPDKGGGVLWCEDADKQRPNSITNSLFLILSARLHARTQEVAYLDWAEKTLAWMREKSLYDGTAIVDGPGHRGDYWSYNQGTFIGGLIALWQTTGRREFLDEAAQVAETVLTRSGLARPDGVLVEKLGTSGDANLFKGIFARYLGQLRDALTAAGTHPELAERLERHLRASTASMLRHGRDAEGWFTAEWHEGAKDRAVNFNTQVSGLALLAATLRD